MIGSSHITRHTSLVKARRAFTIIELLVAVGITAALAGFIIAIVSNVSGFWSRTTGRLSTEAQARYVLNQLTLDLQGAIFRDDGSVCFAATVVNNASGSQGTPWQVALANPKPVGGLSFDLSATRADLVVRGRFTDTRYGNGGTWLRFFTTRRGANDPASAATSLATASAPVAVGYQIVRRFTAATATGVAATRTGYLFHRVEARPAANSANRPGVLETGYGITGAAYTTSSASTNNGSVTGDPRTIQVVSTNARNFDSVIAENVIDFGVRAYVRDTAQATGLRLVFPASDEKWTISAATNVRLISSLPAATPPTPQNYNQVFPEVVDVMVRILTDEGARLIASLEQANSPLTVPAGRNAQQYWWDLADANSQTFTRRIVLNAKSL